MLRAAVHGLSEGPRVLDEGASHHLGHVLRVGAGVAVELFDPVTRATAKAIVVGVHASGRLSVEVGPLLVAPPLHPDVTLLYALSKGDKVDTVVEDATELGAARVVVVRTRRSVVKLDEARATLRRARWTRIATAAARQCGRADVPIVEGVLDLEVAAGAVRAISRFVLHPAGAPLREPLVEALARGDSLAFVIGPEGGFDDDELRWLEGQGYHRASLGDTVLRTETVAAAVLGAVRVLA